MNALRLSAGFAVILVFAILPAVAQEKDAGKVTLKTVKYAGLAEVITQNRGKVIIVDLWGFF